MGLRSYPTPSLPHRHLEFRLRVRNPEPKALPASQTFPPPNPTLAAHTNLHAWSASSTRKQMKPPKLSAASRQMLAPVHECEHQSLQHSGMTCSCHTHPVTWHSQTPHGLHLPPKPTQSVYSPVLPHESQVRNTLTHTHHQQHST